MKNKNCLVSQYFISAFIMILVALSSTSIVKAQDIKPLVSDIISGIVGLAQQNIARTNQIRDLQYKLIIAGCYAGPIDGKIGPNTAAAIRMCNRRNNGRTDGIIKNLPIQALDLYQ